MHLIAQKLCIVYRFLVDTADGNHHVVFVCLFFDPSTNAPSRRHHF